MLTVGKDDEYEESENIAIIGLEIEFFEGNLMLPIEYLNIKSVN